MPKTINKKSKLCIALTLSFVFLIFTCLEARAWYSNTNWTKRVKVSVKASRVNGSVLNFPVYLRMSDLPAGFFTDVASDGSDIRVTKSDGSTEVAREVVFINRSANTGELHFVANGTMTNASNSDFYLYYKYPTVAEPAANSTYGKYSVWSANNYAAVWHLNESPTGTQYNSTSSSYTCSSNGSMLATNRAAGQLAGNGTSFDGSNDFLVCGDVTQLNAVTKYTISGWSKRTGTAAISKYASASFSDICMDFASNTLFGMMIHSGSNTYGSVAASGTNWQYTSMIYNGNLSGNSNRLVMYNNANLLSLSYAGTIPATSSSLLGGYNLKIGSDPASSYYSDGSHDEVRISSVARNGNWIKTEFRNQSAPGTFYNVAAVETNADTQVPNLLTVSPVDNSTNIPAYATLTILFDEYIDLQTGNIYIKNSADDSTFQAISVGSNLVTGNGTNQITIGHNGFSISSGYYIQIDSTAITDLAGNSYAGIADTTTWNFTTGEDVASWYYSNWTKRIKIVIDDSKVNGSVANFPVYVRLSDLPGATFDYIANNGADLRVTTSDGVTEVAREVVFVNKTANAGELHFVATGGLTNAANSDYYLYYRNPGVQAPADSATYGKYNVWTPSNYAAVWHMNENPTGTIYNSASSSYNCGSNGAMLSSNRVAGQLVGNGTSFDGSNDFLQCGDVTQLNAVTKFSITGWAKRTATSNSVAYLSKYSSASVAISSEFYTSNYLGLLNNSNYGYLAQNDTNWHYFAMMFNGNLSGNSNRLNIHNGVSLASLTFSGTIPAVSPSLAGTNVWLGRDSMYGGYTNGRLDEIRVSSVTRTGSWVKTEYNNQNSPSTFYRFATEESMIDTQAPALLTTTPADNSTGASLTNNLVIIFDEYIDIQTGNIYIKKSSDDSTAETIPVSGGLVTGNGTNQITINPSSNLLIGNGYYIQIDATAFEDVYGNSFAGIADTTTWNFTTNTWYNTNWNRRLKVSINKSQVNGSVANFPVYLKLSDLPAAFFDDITNNGADLRITKADGSTLVAREIVWVDRTANAGELHFVANGTMTNTANSDFYLYYKNTTAQAPLDNDTYGKYNVWSNNYIGVWHMQESPTATITNSVTSSLYQGISSGSMTTTDLVNCQMGKCSDFDGVDDRITIVSSPTISNGSISAWTYGSVSTGTDSTQGYMGLVTSGSTGSLMFGHNSSVYSGLYIYGGSWYGGNGSTTATSTWYHHTGTFGAGGLKYYKNGARGSSNSNTTALYGGSLTIGHYFSGYEFNGEVDEVRISNVQRDGSWIKTEYSNQSSPSSFYSVASVETATDNQAPAVSNFSPLDDSTSVDINTSLLITFDDIIDLQAGNIYIKKSSDDSTVQTIAINSNLVTGNGTTQILINHNAFAGNNGYYIQIDATAIADRLGNLYPGISNTSTWNFTTATAVNWYNNNWAKRIKITIDDAKVNGSVSNFPVYVKLNDLPSTFFDDISNNGADLRVTKSDGTTELAREVVFLDKVANAGELHFVANGTLSNVANSDYYLYYESPGAPAPADNSTYGKYNVWTPSSYVAVWHLNEFPTNTMYNSASSSYNCGINGAMLVSNRVQGAAGLSGNGTSFDGSNDFLQCGDVNELDSATKFTISGWARRASVSSTVSLLSKYTNASNFIDSFYYGVYYDGYTLKAGSGYGYVANNDTNWRHTVMVYNGNLSTNATKLNVYLNGAVASLTYNTVPSSTANHNGNVLLGRSTTYGYTSGRLDEIRISSLARSGSWIKTEYNNQNSPNTFYRFSTAEAVADTQVPSIASLTPADDATGASLTNNLVITFDEYIDIQTGNIYIKKSADDSTVETIAVSGVRVSGNGTTQISINPVSDLLLNNGYYVQVDATAFKDLSGNSFAGISNTTTWNFNTNTWYNTNWTKRTKITINKSQVNGSVANFPIYVKLADLPGSTFDSISANGADLRVTKSDGTTLVAREVVWLDRTANAGELHFIANGTLSNAANSDYYLYYNSPAATAPTDSSTYGKYNVWTNNYLAVYHLQESPTGTIYSSVSSSYTGTSAGTMTSTDLVNCQIGKCSDYDGSDDKISITTPAVTNGTLSAWSYGSISSGTDSSQGFLGVNTGGAGSMTLGHMATAYSGISVYTGTWNYANGTTTSTSTWYHNVGTFGLQGLKYYRNGIIGGRSNGNTTALGAGSFAIGQYPYAGYEFNGEVDEVRISTIQRLGSWIKTEYSNQSSPSTFYSIATAETVTDMQVPLVTSLSPADNSTTVSNIANLVISFDEFIDIQTGNIYIKKSSDNSIVETIPVSGGLVTGNGTSVITINPAADLAYGNGYYVQIDATAFNDMAGNSYAGISDTTTWNFSTNNWYNSNWTKRLRITIDDSKVNGTVVNFPVYVRLSDLPAGFFADVANNGTDMRITKSDGITEVAREVVFVNKSASTGELHFVANGALTNAANSDFYLYYKSGATEPAADAAYGKYNVWLASGYVAVWHLHESVASAGTTYNSASTSYNCTSSGAMTASTRVAGNLAGNGTSFDGSNDYLDCGDVNEMDSTTKLTVSSWIKKNSTFTSVAIISKPTTAAASVYQTSFWASSSTLQSTVNNASNAYGYVSTNDTSWHHVAMIYNGNLSGNANRLNLYLDGTASTSFVNSIPASTANQINNLVIGYDAYGGTYTSANNRVDEIRITALSRTGSWLKTEYNNQSSPSTFYVIGSVETVTDTQAPGVAFFTPIDGAVGVSLSSNLTITFDELIDIQTGNIYIKKSVDDSTVETIAVSSGLVTGNGTSVVTINPNSDFIDNNGYYIQIDPTAFKDLAGNSYPGISDTSTWNFTTTGTGAWFNGDWHYRVKATINHNYVNGDLTNYPVYINLNSLSTTNFYSNLLANGTDIRVTKADGTTQVAREVVYANTATKNGELYFVANGTLYSATNGDYYIYYNNPAATEPTANGTYAKEKVWDSNYLGVWHFATDPSVKTYDSTMNNYDCTQSGGMNGNLLVAGKVNYALNFNGTQAQYIDCGFYTFLNARTNLSLSAWMKRRIASANMSMGTSSSSSYAHGITTQASGTIYASPTGHSSAYGTISSNDTNWHQMHWLFDGAQSGNSNRFKIYYDGTLQSPSYTGTVSATSYNSLNTNFRIGYNYWNSQYYTNGYWDEVRLSVATRSVNWVKTEYNNLNSPSTFYTLSAPETVTDIKAPNLTSFTPADNSINANFNTNLTLNFSDYVDTQSGNIIIKKSSDNSTVQTIAANSSAVTGNGTATLTVNINDLMSNNGYYIQIQNTAIKDLAGNAYAGISNSTTWNFTTQAVGNWFNGDWHSRVKVTIPRNYINGSLSNFPVYLNLAFLNGTSFFSDIKSNGADLRVTKLDGTTQVAREVAYIDTTAEVGELYFVANGTNSLTSTYNGTYYLYYNNPSGGEPTANGTYAKERVWSSGYLGVWHMTTDPAIKTYDSTSNNYDCTRTGGMNGNLLVAGKVNYALIFNGTQSQYIDCNITTPLQSLTRYSLSAWLKRGKSSGNMSMGASYTGGGYGLGFYTAAGANVLSTVGTANTTYGSYSSNDTSWHHIQTLYNGSGMGNAGRLKSYYDGSNVTLSYTGTVGTTTSSSFNYPFRIGYIYTASTNYYTHGYWDEVRLSTVTRSNDWAKTEYNNLSSPSTFSLFSVEQGTDIKAPTLFGVDPADNSTGARFNTNLTMTFTEVVDIQTGNIYIKKSSDNSTVQTVAINSSAVTGNGTNVLTVNVNDFMGNNGYYVQIQSGAIKDLAGNSYAGINNTTTWNFTTQAVGNWFNGDWHYRVKVNTVHNYVNGDLSNFPVYLNLALLNGTNFFSNINTNGSDLRVTKIDGTTQVAREVVYTNNVARTGELYFLANGTNALSATYNGTYYIYYNNPVLATEPSANGVYAKESVWVNSYLGVWHFATDPSVKTYDSTSNNYDGTQTGGMNGNALVAGKINYALLFNGTQSQYVATTVPEAAMANETKLSLSAWIKRRSASANFALGGTGIGSNFFGFTSPNSASMLTYAGYSTNDYGSYTSNDTNWHHLSMLYNGTASGNTGKLRSYLDGSSQTLSYNSAIQNTTYTATWQYPFYMGIGYIGGWRYSNAYYDEVRLSSVTRTPNWTKTEYNNLNSSQTFSTLSVETANDTKAPTIYSLTPVDNSTGVRYNTNLTMAFTEYVDTQSGNIYIKKSSDNSTVQTLKANSVSVTGNGTTTLTVELNDLMSNNGYYIQIQNTAIKDLAGNAYAGISNTSSWNFTTQTLGAWYNGDWHYRVKVAIDPAKVNGDLTNYPVYVNLNGMPASFFSYLNANGSDIRVTKLDGTSQVAREVAYVDKVNRTGELYFVANGTLSHTYQDYFYIYYGNPLLTEPTVNGTYAKESTWVNYFGVWHFNPEKVGDDSTSNNMDTTEQRGIVDDLVIGPVNFAMDLNGSGYGDYVRFSPTPAISKTKLSLSTWLKRKSVGKYAAVGATRSSPAPYQRLGIFAINGSIATTVNGSRATFSSNDTNWHHINMLYNGSQASNATKLRTYFDGSAQTLTFAGSIPSTTASDSSYFDAGAQYGTPAASGTYAYYADEVRLSSVARSPDWAKTEYNNLSSPQTFYALTYETAVETKAPTLISRTPADNSTGVRYNTNLTMVFSEYIDTQSGNIIIKKTSNNATIQTIAANSGSVTGNGTTTLTVDLNDLNVNNGYYVQIQNTAIKDLSGNAYAGISNTTSWNFTTQSLGAWYNGDWHYRVKVTIDPTKVNGDLTNYPVYINLNGLNATSFFDYLRTNGTDIRVTKADGISEVAREVAYINTTGNAGELYFVANGTLSKTYADSFYIYYGNPIMTTEPTANGTYAKERVWSTGYLGVWHLNPNNYNDSTSNNYDCTSIYGGLNGNNLVAGKVNYALLFNGAQSQYIACGSTITALQSRSAVSLSGWMKRSRSSANMGVGNQNNVPSIGALTSTLGMSVTNSGQEGTFSSNDTNWHHLFSSYDGTFSNSTTRLKIYLDGAQNSLSYINQIPATTSGTISSPFTIGLGFLYNSSLTSTGYWDEVRLSTVGRSRAWAITEYNNLNSPATFYSFAAIEAVPTDIKPPVLLTTTTPADNSTGQRLNVSLVMNFSDYVDTQTGANIYIKKTSDNSTVQTISATSGSVTGNGTATLTVDINDLMSNNGYYIQIDSNAIKDLAGNAFAGIADTTTWNFTTRTEGAWFNGSWLYRTKISTNNLYVNGSSLTNFPIYVDLSHLSFKNFFNLTKNDGSDIRVTKIDGTSEVAREVASFNATSNAGEMYFVANGSMSGLLDEDFYIYYGNAGASEPTANGSYAKERVWSTGYIGVWHFNTDPSVKTYDSTSNNYDCTQTGSMNSADLVAGKVNYALDFDGSNDYVDCNITTAIQSKNRLSLSGWLKRRSASVNVTMGASYTPGNMLGTVAHSGGNLYSVVNTPNTGGYSASNDTNWHYVGWMFNGSAATNATKLLTYIDSTAVTSTYPGTVSTSTPSSFNYAFRIGYIYDATGVLGYGTYANGYWDEVRLSSVTRTPDWTKTEYYNLNSPSTFYYIGASNKKGNPAVASFSPVDNGTYVSPSANLVINFDEYVTLQSGNIYIKKSSDNSLLETISVSGGRVTISGNGQVATINPVANLPVSNGIYIQIDANAFKDPTLNGYPGIANTTTWNFTTSQLFPEDWLTGGLWTNRIKLEINKSQVNGNVQNFPIYVNLNGMPASFTTNSLANGADLRITKSDGTTQVARDLVFLNRTANAGELHFVANGTLTNSSNGIFYLYYNNTSATQPLATDTYGKYNTWTPAGYVAVWHLNESPASAATLYNSASSSYNCTSYGSMLASNRVAGAVGLAGNGTSFDGSNDYLLCGDVTELNSATKYSITGWGKRASTGQIVTLLHKMSNATNNLMFGYYTGNEQAFLSTSSSWGYGYSSPTNDANWHHLAMVYNGNLSTNATRLNLYADSTAQTLSFSGTVAANSGSLSGVSVRIGYDNVYSGAYTVGSTDEIRVSSITRDANWIKTEYNNQSSPSTFYSLSAQSTVGTVAAFSFSPADGSMGVPVDANLVINFDRKIDIQTGNIYIKKTAGNTLVEAIPVTSGAVTGNGTSQITINPPSDLVQGNGYYVQVDASAFDDTAGTSYAGISDTSSWNFTTTGIGVWFNGDWHYRIKATVNHSYVNGDLTNFPVYINLNSLSGTSFYTYASANGTDLRVTKVDGTTQVAREAAFLNKTTKKDTCGCLFW